MKRKEKEREVILVDEYFLRITSLDRFFERLRYTIDKWEGGNRIFQKKYNGPDYETCLKLRDALRMIEGATGSQSDSSPPLYLWFQPEDVELRFDAYYDALYDYEDVYMTVAGKSQEAIEQLECRVGQAGIRFTQFGFRVTVSPREDILKFLEDHSTITDEHVKKFTNLSSPYDVHVEFYKLQDQGLLERVPGTKGLSSAWRLTEEGKKIYKHPPT